MKIEGESMRKAAFAKVLGLGGAIIIAGITVGAAAPASAATAAATGTADGVTRVVDRTSEAMPVDSAAIRTLHARIQSLSTAQRTEGSANVGAVRSTADIPLPAGVTMKPGETVLVNYADGVVTHTAITASCTSTSSAQTPYKDSGYAWSYHDHHLSAGCAGGTSVNGLLETKALTFGWTARDFETVTVDPNSSMYWATDAKCKGSSNTSWHGLNSIGSSVTAQSATKTLACSV
jgi:hypothetical protein